MKNFGGYVMIMLLFFIAALAFMEEDRRCSEMYGTGGRIVSEVSESVSAVVRIMADGR